MPIDPRSTDQYAYAVDLLIQLAEDDEDVEAYCDENDPEVIYADLEERGYTWTGDGWYTAEYIDELKAQARAAQTKAKATTRRRRRRTKDEELELLRQWNAVSSQNRQNLEK